MKTVFLLIAGAAAMAPPRIELDLSAMTAVSNTKLNSKMYSNLIAQHVSATAAHAYDGTTDMSKMQTATYDANGIANGKKHITSRQDWSQQCPAGASNIQTCPFPVARAYDHNDQTVSVSTNVYLIDFENKPTFEKKALPLKIKASDIFGYAGLKAKRATYLFKYDAVDQAGNRAEQVVFALILNDLKAPKISTCYSEKRVVVEAATQLKSTGKFNFFCAMDAFKSLPPSAGSAARPITTKNGVSPRAHSSKYEAIDNIDGAIDNEIRFNVFQLRNGQTSKQAIHTGLTLGKVRTLLDTRLANSEALSGRGYIIEAHVSDHAGYYGRNGGSNKQNDMLIVKIQDKTSPNLVLQGANVEYGECCRAGATNCAKQTHVGYTDKGCHAFDANDGDISSRVVTHETPFSLNGKRYTSNAVKSGNKYTVDLTKEGVKKVYHTVRDHANNKGIRQETNTFYAMRTVNVVDRNRPSIALKGGDTVLLKSTRKNGKNAKNYIASLDKGVTRDDTCKSTNNLFLDISWVGKSPGDLTTLGQFTRKYKLCDRTRGGVAAAGCDIKKNLWVHNQHCCADNSVPSRVIPCCDSVTRKFDVVDAEAPEINVMGDKKLTIDASISQEYTDAGATCNDYVDGVLSHAVEVSGEVVNMRKPGKYTIRYDCVDLSGKEAEAQFRVVTVVDRTCPQIKLKGVAVNYVEAGFKYKDAGFTATDDLDGVISGKGPFGARKAGCKTDGNTVNVGQAFYSRRSCKAIKNNCGKGQSCPTGEYYISAYNKKKNQYQRILVWCNMDSGKTYYPITNAKIPAVQGVQNAANDCQNLGLEMCKFSTKREKETALDKFCGANRDACSMFSATNDAKVHSYMCSTNDEAALVAKKHANAPSTASNMKNGAETGNYVIQFYCKDKAGNKDCDWKKGKKVSRQVFVKDTLPPVITLHLRNKLIATGKGDQIGLNDQANPAGTAAGNPNIPSKLMAEETTTSVNGWIVGALASAVTGLALLGYSLRKSDNVVTSVPV